MAHRAQIRVARKGVGDERDLFEHRRSVVPRILSLALHRHQRGELRLVAGVGPAEQALAAEGEHTVRLPAEFRFRRRSLTRRPGKRLDAAPERFAVFARRARNDIHRLAVLFVGGPPALRPVQRIDVCADVRHLEHLAKRVAVLFVEGGIGIVILDGRSMRAVLELGGVGVHRQQVDVGQLAFGLTAVRVADFGQLGVLIRSRLIRNVGAGKTRMIIIVRRRRRRVAVRAIPQDQLHTVTVALAQQPFAAIRSRQRPMGDDPVKAGRTVCGDKVIRDRVGTQMDPGADADTVAGQIRVGVGRIDSRAQRLLDRRLQQNGRLGAAGRPCAHGRLDAVVVQPRERPRPVALGDRSPRAERTRVGRLEHLPGDCKPDGLARRFRQFRDIVQRRFALREPVGAGQACDEPRVAAAVGVAKRDHPLAAGTILRLKTHHRRFRRRRHRGRAQQEIVPLIAVIQTPAGNPHLLHRRDKTRGLRVVGRVHGRIEEGLRRFARREEPEPRDFVDGIRVAGIGRVKAEAGDRAVPRLVPERAHVHDRVSPGAVAGYRKRRIALVRQLDQRVGREKKPGLPHRGTVFVANGKEGAFCGGECVRRIHRHRHSQVGAGRHQFREADFRAELSLADRHQPNVGSVVEDPRRLARQQRRAAQPPTQHHTGFTSHATGLSRPLTEQASRQGYRPHKPNRPHRYCRSRPSPAF